jgi:hypothetical protein
MQWVNGYVLCCVIALYANVMTMHAKTIKSKNLCLSNEYFQPFSAQTLHMHNRDEVIKVLERVQRAEHLASIPNHHNRHQIQTNFSVPKSSDTFHIPQIAASIMFAFLAAHCSRAAQVD